MSMFGNCIPEPGPNQANVLENLLSLYQRIFRIFLTQDGTTIASQKVNKCIHNLRVY